MRFGNERESELESSGDEVLSDVPRPSHPQLSDADTERWVQRRLRPALEAVIATAIKDARPAAASAEWFEVLRASRDVHALRFQLDQAALAQQLTLITALHTIDRLVGGSHPR